MRVTIMNLLALVFFLACDTGPAFLVDRFGTFTTPDPGKQLVVTRREKSLIDFKVVSTTTGKPLAAGYIGSDAMRWFLYWESSSRLWFYGSDTGFFKVLDFRPDGTVAQAEVTEAMTIPHVVWCKLPSSMQQRYKAASNGASSRSQAFSSDTNPTSTGAASPRSP